MESPKINFCLKITGKLSILSLLNTLNLHEALLTRKIALQKQFLRPATVESDEVRTCIKADSERGAEERAWDEVTAQETEEWWSRGR